jgi:hypothetical protein
LFRSRDRRGHWSTDGDAKLKGLKHAGKIGIRCDFAKVEQTTHQGNGSVTLFDWLSLISLIVSISLPAIGLLARNWVKARIEKGVQHRFDVKIEAVRAELRKSEESFKSDLRDKEAEIATLRKLFS